MVVKARLLGNKISQGYVFFSFANDLMMVKLISKLGFHYECSLKILIVMETAKNISVRHYKCHLSDVFVCIKHKLNVQ